MISSQTCWPLDKQGGLKWHNREDKFGTCRWLVEWNVEIGVTLKRNRKPWFCPTDIISSLQRFELVTTVEVAQVSTSSLFGWTCVLFTNKISKLIPYIYWTTSVYFLKFYFNETKCWGLSYSSRDHISNLHVPTLTPRLMVPGGSMPHSQGHSNYPYPVPNQPNSPHWYLSLQGPF